MSRLATYFFRGLLVIVPVVTTVLLVRWVVDAMVPLFEAIGGQVAKDGESQVGVIVIGVSVSIVGITAVGMFASNFVGRQVVRLMENLFEQVPLVKLLYGSIKDLMSAFVGDKKSFDRPVLVSLSADGAAKVIGFVTRDSLDFLGVEGHVAVYLPQSYNFAGNLLLFPRDQVRELDAPSSEVMGFLVSGGVSGK